jgi:hypothetical protein
MTNIFNHRIDSAAQRLNSLDSILRRLDKRADHVKSLREDLDKDRGQINDTLDKLTDRLDRILKLCGEKFPEVGEIRNATEVAKGQLTRLRDLIEAARSKANDITVVQLNPAALTQRAGEFKQKIAIGRDQLETIRANGCGDGPWANFRDLSSAWMEYLDYLAGLCLRHECVDDRVCEIADALIDELETKAEGLSALAIPGRESGAGTLPRAVYLRFPEWTVWALPLATRELWHIAREASFLGKNFARFAERKDLPANQLRDRLLHECFADIFATYVMGPSYACAALLLALDPLKPTHQDRAATILETLLWLGSSDDQVDRSEINPYHDVHSELQRSWEQAVTDAHPSPKNVSEHLELWMKAFLDYLATVDRLRFPTEQWVALKDQWTDALRSSSVDTLGNVEALPVDGTSVRYALNAAWQVRLDQPAQSHDRLAETCTKLCRRIMDVAGNHARFSLLAANPQEGSAPNLVN